MSCQALFTQEQSSSLPRLSCQECLPEITALGLWRALFTQWTSCVGQLEIIITPPFFFSLAPRGLWDLSSLTRDRTQVLGSESVSPKPLDHQGTPDLYCKAGGGGGRRGGGHTWSLRSL